MLSNYQTTHSRIRTVRGWASEYRCIDCGQPAHDWSWVHDTDSDDICNYEPRCRSCHKKYDYTNEWRDNLSIMKYGNTNALGHTVVQGSKQKNSKLEEDDIPEIRAMYASGIYYMRDIAEIYGVDRSLISGIINGKSWKHVP